MSSLKGKLPGPRRNNGVLPGFRGRQEERERLLPLLFSCTGLISSTMKRLLLEVDFWAVLCYTDHHNPRGMYRQHENGVLQGGSIYRKVGG